MASKKTTRENSKTTRLVILDSHAIIHRAYHALPDFTSSKGEPTGALYGLTTMLLKSFADLKPDYIVAARDRAEKTHRHEVYENYKATRAKTDDALIEQLIKAEKVFDAFGIPVYDAAGFEADDVVGTIAKQLSKQKNIEIIVVTGDMDLLQLVVDGKVEVYRLLTGLSNMKFYDEAAVRERYGFGPEHVPDLKGIMGDASDNIKGVPGVGEGSALKLVQTFGGIDEIYTAIKKLGVEEVAKKAGIQKRYAQLMADNEEAARFSKELATISPDAPIQFQVPREKWTLADHAQSVIALCDELEFRSIKERVAQLAGQEVGVEAAEIKSAVPVDAKNLEETKLALWLLHSDTTNPSLEDILNYTHTDDFETARTKIFADLAKAPRVQEVFETIEKPLLPVVRRMNETGILVDTLHLKSLAKEYSKELAGIAARVYREAGHEFNINSPKQLGTVLYDELKISAPSGKQKKTATGARTTREDELQKMADGNPIIGEILAYRELQKLLGTYIEKMPALVGEDNRLHATFLQTGTVTGRMGCENPNLQNIPIKSEHGRRIREGFVAQKGFILASLDYSQIELRIAAALSGDKKLIEIFKNGEDVHAATAAQVFGVAHDNVDREMRRKAKVINFGILYGMGVNALRANLGAGVSREEAASFLAQYFKNFAGLAAYIEAQKALARQKGYTETLFGRRRYFPGINSPLQGIVAQAERMAINAPIQGTQADIIKLAMVEADTLIEKNGWRETVRLELQVHDELVYEIEEKDAEKIAREICHVMESVVAPEKIAGVPILAEIALGKNWGNVKKIKK
ncbi:MAG TPA: DNA polymerase [Candidatus Paceibacterota bacterium]|nr:DNA polymerase [Candidatus Paceibacterota bacterium]